MYLSLDDTLNDETTSTSENAESQRIYGPMTYEEYLATLPLDLHDPNGGGGMILMACGCCDPGCGCGCAFTDWSIYLGDGLAGAPDVVYACKNGSHSASDTWITIQNNCDNTASIPAHANVNMACYYNSGIKVDDPGKEYFAINTLTGGGTGYQNGTFTWKKPDNVTNAQARRDFTFTYFVYYDANHDGKLDPNEEASIQTLGTLKAHIAYAGIEIEFAGEGGFQERSAEGGTNGGQHGRCRPKSPCKDRNVWQGVC